MWFILAAVTNCILLLGYWWISSTSDPLVNSRLWQPVAADQQPPYKLAERRWGNFINCLRLTNCSEQSLQAVPPDFVELQAHFLDLLKESSKFRGLSLHEHGGYHGPWVEDTFITWAADRSFADFYPLVPLFLQVRLSIVLRMQSLFYDVLFIIMNLPTALIGRQRTFVFITQS
jgi:hypothetical protein